MATEEITGKVEYSHTTSVFWGEETTMQLRMLRKFVAYVFSVEVSLYSIQC